MKGKIEINGALCKECHLCITVCKKANIVPTDKVNADGYRPVKQKDDADCNGCALCALICPEIAIEVYRE
ncbi:MAG: 4Fe-4S dicluster domain-containing protein [Syntrophobacteraceae bacterium]